MDAGLKQRWIEALESGGYAKGKYGLRRRYNGEETWCCLGMLADVIDPDGWVDIDILPEEKESESW